MMMNEYPEEILDQYNEDDGTMSRNVATLAEHVVGHRIVKVEKGSVKSGWRRISTDGLIITLDNGKRVTLADTDDCCAYTDLEDFLLHIDQVDHLITGVGTTDGYNTWHIFADYGDVLELTVGWSCGNPFYYMYGFHIAVEDADDDS